jgi:uncharacterized protein with ParB-like and HNH nuclease domain
MSFQPSITVYKAIQNIDKREYLLPSIQREFTWWEDQIRWLFDSLMQGYPINSFLLWKVVGKTKDKFKFYQMLDNYVERHKTHNEEFVTKGSEFYGVLDGQQRLTSLYIGLKGTFAWHKYYSSWQYSPDNFPPRKLYINIAGKLEENEEGQEYNFQFLTEHEYLKENTKWMLVGDILNVSSSLELINLIKSNPNYNNDLALSIISRLYDAIHKDAPINYYVEESQEIDKALNIFIRINKNGTPLAFSDLVMSIVTAHWKGDARKLIYGLVDEIFRNYGFLITKDFILKTYLYLYSEDIRFKVDNFSIDLARQFEANWPNIRQSILTAYKLIKDYGFVEQTLPSKNAILPIIYHIYMNNYLGTFDSQVRFDQDRRLIKKWLHVVLLKQTFGASSDTVLKNIRGIIKGESIFPAKNIVDKFVGTNKDMSFDDDFIDNLLKLQKDQPLTFTILSLLYPNLDYKNGNFHKDHIYPADYFKDDYLSNANISINELQFYKNSENWNSICNLQLIDANDNMSKNNGAIKPWVLSTASKLGMNIAEFCAKYLIPQQLEFSEFMDFIMQRKKILSDELKKQTIF